MRRQQAASIDKDRSNRIKPISFVTAALLACVVASIPLFGTLIAMILGCVLLPLLWGERRMKVLIPYVILFPATVAILFTQVLKVYFEPGLWGPTIG
jgi:putative tricarboxylic transport membrane protein